MKKYYNFFAGYTKYLGKTCSTVQIYYLEITVGIEQCISWCNDKPNCLGFTHTDKGDCSFWDDTCEERNLEATDEGVTYIKN